MTVKTLSSKYNVGQRVLTIMGYGVIECVDKNDQSIFYHVKLDNDKGRYIFSTNQILDVETEVTIN